MQKLIHVDGVGFPLGKLNKVEPNEVRTITNFGTLNEDFTVCKSVEQVADVNLYFDGLKNPVSYEVKMGETNEKVYLPTNQEFLDWIEDLQTESGKSASKLFRGALAKIAKIKQLIKEVEERKANNEKLIGQATPVVEQAIQTSTPVEMSTQVEGENGVSLEVALKDITDEPTLPFNPPIVVQPELKTDSVMANEEIMQFNMPTVSDEDMLTLQKKTKFVAKWCNKYLSEVETDEEVTSLIAKRGSTLDETEMQLKDHVLKLVENNL